MPDLVLERHVPHLPEKMFELVNDLPAYPRFLPNCHAMEVRQAVDGARLAKMTIRFGPVTQAYTSKVTADPDTLTIRADSKDGPFAYLYSKWTFTPEGEGTRVRFDVDFKIGNRLIAAVAEPAFEMKQTEIMDAFVKEADRRFGV